MLAGLIDLGKVTHFLCTQQSSGSGFKNARVRGLLSTFAFTAMNNKENETGYKFSSDQTLEKMYVLMECIRYKGYNQTFSHLLKRSI